MRRVLRRLRWLLAGDHGHEGAARPNRNEVVAHLQDVCTRIGVVEHGVGVVAVRDIAAGSDPFAHCAKPSYHRIRPEELADCDPAVLRMVKDFLAVQDGATASPRAASTPSTRRSSSTIRGLPTSSPATVVRAS